MFPASAAVLLALAVAVAVLPTWEALEFSLFALAVHALLCIGYQAAKVQRDRE